MGTLCLRLAASLAGAASSRIHRATPTTRAFERRRTRAIPSLSAKHATPLCNRCNVTLVGGPCHSRLDRSQEPCSARKSRTHARISMVVSAAPRPSHTACGMCRSQGPSHFSAWPLAILSPSCRRRGALRRIHDRSFPPNPRRRGLGTEPAQNADSRRIDSLSLCYRWFTLCQGCRTTPEGSSSAALADY